MLTTRLTPLLALFVSAGLLLTACSGGTAPTHDPQTGVSDALVRDSVQFQRPDGLFVLPESLGAGSGANDLATTAQYVSSLGATAVDGLNLDRFAATALPPSLDVSSAEAQLVLRRAAKHPPLTRDQTRRLAAALVLPAVQAEAGAEIGALAVWADGRDLARAAGGDVPVPGTLAGRLAAVDPGSVEGHPYLVHRLAQVYESVRLTPPTWLAAATKDLLNQTLPSPTTTESVLDGAAIVQRRELAGLSPRAPAEFLDTALRVLALDGALEDLPRAQLLGLLLRVSPRSAIAAPLKTLSARVSRDTGLITSSVEPTVTVQATYLFSRLLDLRFREVASPATIALLRTAATDATTPLTSRLQAAAALKAAGDKTWAAVSRPLLKQLPQPGPVGLLELPDYLLRTEAALQLDPSVRKGSLMSFDPGKDEAAQRTAAAALSRAYLFDNEIKVGLMFPDLQTRLKAWVDKPDTPLPILVEAAAALPTSGIIRPTSAYLQSIGGRIRKQLGCHGATALLSVDGTAGGQCSLLLTLSARAIPGAIYG